MAYKKTEEKFFHGANLINFKEIVNPGLIQHGEHIVKKKLCIARFQFYLPNYLRLTLLKKVIFV